MYGIIHKLCLPIYDPVATLSVGVKKHDCWGDCTISCSENSMQIVHNFILDEWALALQRVIAMAGYILPTAKPDAEEPHLLECDTGTNPLNL